MIKYILAAAAAYEFAVGVSMLLYSSHPGFAYVAELPSVASVVDPLVQPETAAYGSLNTIDGVIDIATATAIYFIGIRNK